jgi:hypothetical protein
MSAPPPSALFAALAFVVRAMCEGIAGQYRGGPLGGSIPGPLIAVINERIKGIRDRLIRLAERIVAGTYVPRRTAPPRRRPVTETPRLETPFRKRGWLDAMLPAAVAQQYRGHLLALLRHPEMAALVAVAPAPMAGILRPLCWALKLKPPAILATPRRPAGTPPPVPPEYQPPPPPPPPIPAPSNTLGLHPIQLLAMTPPPKPA